MDEEDRIKRYGNLKIADTAQRYTPQGSFIKAEKVCIPTNSVRGFPFLYTLSAFIACRLLKRSHCDWFEMVPHCGFDLHFSDNE